MKDFITYCIRSGLAKKQVFDIVKRTLPDFQWRQGDSDAQGPYVSGSNDDHVQIQLWLGEDPVDMFVSFSRAWMDAGDREKKKSELIEVVDKSVAPLLGAVTKKDA